MNFIYGPVNSRRLGISLGISIVKMKTCNFDCIYCELGKTLDKTEKRIYDVGADEILSELDLFFKSYKDTIDILTITGYGEPTLNKNLPVIAKAVREKYPKHKLALLTNSSCIDGIIGSSGFFDVIVPCLNAVSEVIFDRINRPAPGFTSSAIVSNLILLRKNFSGSLELSILFCRGINDGLNEICLLLEAVRMIKPDKVWINTVVRHPAYPEAMPITERFSAKLDMLFNSPEKFDKAGIKEIIDENETITINATEMK